MDVITIVRSDNGILIMVLKIIRGIFLPHLLGTGLTQRARVQLACVQHCEPLPLRSAATVVWVFYLIASISCQNRPAYQIHVLFPSTVHQFIIKNHRRTKYALQVFSKEWIRTQCSVDLNIEDKKTAHPKSRVPWYMCTAFTVCQR